MTAEMSVAGQCPLTVKINGDGGVLYHGKPLDELLGQYGLRSDSESEINPLLLWLYMQVAWQDGFKDGLKARAES